MKRLLILDALHAGSHAAWSKGLANHLPNYGWNVELLTLPGRHWKWRMQQSGWWFADQIARKNTPRPDVILATDMVDVARLRGSLPRPWRNLPIVAYFHENQLTFPWKVDGNEHLQTGYAFANLQSAAVADALWFNSNHHREAFLNAIPGFWSKFPDARIPNVAERLRNQSLVVYPGVDLPTFNLETLTRPISPKPVLLWNHRWDYDKNPSFFLETARCLLERGISFSVDLMGLGNRQDTSPLCELLVDPRVEIVNAEPASTKEKYWQRLVRADAIPHAPLQEYFGMSIVEAMHAGVLPILPKTHAYPEYAASFRHVSNPLAAAKSIEAIGRAPAEAVVQWRLEAHQAVSQFGWQHCASRYAEALNGEVQVDQ